MNNEPMTSLSLTVILPENVGAWLAFRNVAVT